MTRLVSHEIVRHAAHYMDGAGGHDLEQWVIAAPAQPPHEQVVALGVAADARWHSGQIVAGEQRWMYTARRPLSAGTCERCRKACPPHPRSGMRPGLTLAQLDDLARSAIDAGDRVAFTVIALAAVPERLGGQPHDIEHHAMAHAIDAWVGRCCRTGGRPWMRSFHDPAAERPCPGCEACAASAGITTAA